MISEYGKLNSNKDLPASEIINFFVKKYYSILYVDKMIGDKDREILIEALDDLIIKLQTDESNEHYKDYASHYEFVKVLFQ